MSALYYDQARRLTRSAFGDDAAEKLFKTDDFDAWLWEQSEAIAADNFLDTKEGGDGTAGTIAFCHRLVKKHPELVQPGFDPDTCERADDEPLVRFDSSEDE